MARPIKQRLVADGDGWQVLVMHHIRTEAVIPAPPEEVWAVLTDFDRFAAWNPLNIKAAGRPSVGARVPMTFVNPAKDGATVSQKVTITVCEPNAKLEWIGRVPILFTGRHFFHLTPMGGGTHLSHGEDQTGLIAWSFSQEVIDGKFVPVYKAFNVALAARIAQLG